MNKLSPAEQSDRLERAFQRACDLMTQHSIECCQLAGEPYFRTFALRSKYAACADRAYSYMEELAQ